MENGRIATTGSHEQLLQTSDLYRQVYDLQLRPSPT
jgi:ABC-type multidrug transport system fused ATPase/permease subunit